MVFQAFLSPDKYRSSYIDIYLIKGTLMQI